MVRKLEDMTVKVRREAHKKAWDEVVRSKPALKDSVRAESPENIPTTRRKSSKGSRYGIWLVAVFSIAFLFFSFSFLFSGATLNVGPRVEQLSLNQNFSAVKGSSSGALPFDLVAIEGVESKEVAGGEEKSVSRRAEGTVVVYNAFSSATQRLDTDTRLQGSNGKIYKTKKAIVIPGMKGATPGSVEVGVYGVEAGEAYNSGPLDFSIVGFKGTSKYSKFYARSKGNLAGGFIGKERDVPEAEKAQVLAELKDALKAKLLQKATDQIPPGFILFKDAATVLIDEENFKSSNEAETVEITVKGTLHGVLFEEKALTKKVAEKKFPKDADDDIYILNIKNLEFSLNEGSVGQNFANAQNLNFNLSGDTKAIWRVDEDKLMSDILGKKKSEINQILAQYQNIISANLSLRPFWKLSLPDNKEDVTILVAYPQE